MRLRSCRHYWSNRASRAAILRFRHDPRPSSNPLLAATQYPGDRLMYPRVYLQITGVLRCKPQLNTTVGAHVSGLCVAGRILHDDSEEPLARWPLADLTLVVH